VTRPALLRLTARFPIAKQPLPERAAGTATAARSTRASPLAPNGELPVYAHADLIGREVSGPLVVDGGTFTWYVGPHWRLLVDRRGDARATRAGE